MSTADRNDPNKTLRRATQVIVVGSVMFTFISYWKTAAVVLCDLASTAYYIGGIAEQAIGPAAPWFILAVMVFSYAVRNVYIESCSMFVRGGVYRVVREAMGGFMAKLSVSALIFDYVLTGPISAVSAGQYIFGLLIETGKYFNNNQNVFDDTTKKLITQWGSVLFAAVVTLYFFWLNLKGIHESSDKAFKIMVATTVMAVLIVGWCLATLAVQGPFHCDRPSRRNAITTRTIQTSKWIRWASFPIRPSRSGCDPGTSTG
jgi:amino acid transporter